MTGIKGQYLYNLQSGETVARKYKEYETGENDNGNYTSTMYYGDYNRELYVILQDNVSQIRTSDHIECGTVENLTFTQTVQMFVSGNLTTDELQIGLESKEVSDLNITEKDGMTTVTFKYEGKEYTLKCATDAAASQVDDITAEWTEDSVSVKDTTQSHLVPIPNKSWEYDADGQVIYSQGTGYNNEAMFIMEVVNPVLDKYFGSHGPGLFDPYQLTDEQIEIVVAHEDEFGFHRYENGNWGLNNTYYKYLMSKDALLKSGDEYYSFYVNQFAEHLSEDAEWGGVSGNGLHNIFYSSETPVFNVKFDGSNIEFTDKTVQCIKEYLAKCSDNNATEYMKMFGFSVNDDEAAIWEKINNFCTLNGSSDGKTLSLENYYNAVCNDKILESSYPIRNYEECVEAFNSWMNEHIYTTATSVYNNTSSIGSATTLELQQTMPVGGIEITEEDIENARDAKQQQIIDDFVNKIKNYRGYNINNIPLRFFGSGDIPIYAVELDDSGNVIFGDKFKEALKLYFSTLIKAIKADIDLYDSNLQSIRNQGSAAGTAMTNLCQEQFLALFGLQACPMDFTEPYKEKPNMEAWMADIQSYLDDDSKMETLLDTFCKNIGATEEKSLSVEQYYTLLAENKIYETLSGTSRTFSTDNNIDSYAKIDAYLEKLKEKYPEVYDLCRYFLYHHSLSYNPEDGIVRGYLYVDLQGNKNMQEYTNYYFNDGLVLAAGITGDESFSEQREKMKNLFIKMGADPNDRDLKLDITQLLNYLLGDNLEKINYFDMQKAKETALAEEINNTQLEVGTPDNNIRVEKYEPLSVDETPSIVDEMTAYLKELVQPIYDKYYICDMNDSNVFTNFNLMPVRNPDDIGYSQIDWLWKDSALKEACAKEMEDAAQKFADKYSDVLTSVIYDGQRILFSTIYDNESSLNDTQISGLAHTAGGALMIDTYLVPTHFELTIDTPKIYTPAPKVIENNIPQNAPVGIHGEKVVKTAWDGIWCSENGDNIYLWDSKEQKYITIETYISGANGGTLQQSLANGYFDGLPTNTGCDVDNILLSLIYGYNRTESTYIFEKDGKYYELDDASRNHNASEGIEKLHDKLIEVSFADGVQTPATPAKSTATTTQAESNILTPPKVQEVPVENTDTEVVEVHNTLNNEQINLTTTNKVNNTNVVPETLTVAPASDEVLTNSPATLEFQQTMPVGGISYTEDDEIKIYNNIKRKQLDKFVEIINKSTYKYDEFFFTNDYIPIYEVEVDENLNIVIGDKFKTALKNYLRNLVFAETSNIQEHDKRFQEQYKGSLFYNDYVNEQFFSMLGLTDIEDVYDWSKTNPNYTDMYAWIDNIQSYIDDEAKLDSLIAEYCKNIGSTDGKTVTVEQYYAALANNEIEYAPLNQYDLTYFKIFYTDEQFRDSAKAEACLAELEKNYPQVYEYIYGNSRDGVYGLEPTGFSTQQYPCYMFSVDNDIKDIVFNNSVCERTSVLAMAAGITENDSKTQQEAKLITLYAKMGADNGYIKMSQYYGYLLGNNSEGVNYFNIILEAEKAKLNTKTETIQCNANVPVKEIKPTEKLEIQQENSKITEIRDYLNNLLAPIYQKYYGTYGYDGSYLDTALQTWFNGETENFKYINPNYIDKNSPFYGKDLVYWKDEETKKACAKEIGEAIQEALEKYSDILTSVIYNGYNVLFTTIYDDETAHIPYTKLNGAVVETAPAKLNGLVNVAGGIRNEKGDYLVRMQEDYEPTVDTPIIYTPAPKVIENNIPEYAPIGINGENLIKTAWDGILVSENKDTLYLWDSKEEKYIAIVDDTSHFDLEKLAAGEIDALECNYETLNIIFSLVCGYNRTNVSYIFEKDGKYYALNQGYKSDIGFKDMLMDDSIRFFDSRTLTYLNHILMEVSFADGVQTPATPATPDTPVVPTSPVEPKTPVVPTVPTEPEASDEDIVEDNDYYSALAKTIAPKAAALGYEQGDDGNYYFSDENGTYLCLWNYWTNSFDRYLIATAEDDVVELEPDGKGGFEASENTLESLFAESTLKAKKYGMTPASDTGVFELNNTRYVFDIEKKTFVSETDALKNNARTWVQVYREALSLAMKLGYKPSSRAFCIFEDANGNKFKYDADKQEFVKYNL